MEARRCLLLVGLVLVVLTGCKDRSRAETDPSREPVEDPSELGERSRATRTPASGPEDPPTVASSRTKPRDLRQGSRAGPTTVYSAATTPEVPRLPSVARDDEASEPEDKTIDPDNIRASVLAGAWYPGEAIALAEMVDGFLDGASAAPEGYPIALISPHAGLRYSGAVAGHAYAALRGRTYGRVFVIGPSHRTAFHGVSLPNYDAYETPLGRITVDRETIAILRAHPLFDHHENAHLQEHSVEIQLPFLQRALGETRWTFVPMLVGRMSPDETDDAGDWLRSVLAPGDLVVASSDFTHWGQGYGYAGPPGAGFGPEEAPERLPALMEAAWTAIHSGDPGRFRDHKRDTGDTICGFLPIAMLMQAVPDDVTSGLRATDTSGTISGDWSRSVSYLAAQYSGLWPYSGVGVEPELGVSEEEKDALLRLARGTVETWVRERRRPTPEELGVTLTPRLEADSGVFVTLKKAGRLRGCVGNIPPSKPLFQGVLDNAVNATTRDRRFPPVTPEELGAIEIEISVLTPPVPVERPWDVVLGKHGVWLEKQGRSAVFLPQVAPEQGWTLPQTLARLSRKAGLDEDAWKEGMTFRVIEAIVFGEEHP